MFKMNEEWFSEAQYSSRVKNAVVGCDGIWLP